MLKTHELTGLKYLCKTSKSNPYTYCGSGKIWKRHLNKYGRKIKTKILAECKTQEELIKKGLYYSKLWDVVNSKDFANLVPERGDGGPNFLGGKLTEEQLKKKSLSQKKFWKNASQDYKEKRKQINQECHEKYCFYTPNGVFTNSYVAAQANNCTWVTIYNRCIKHCDKPIMSKKYWKFGWKGKTWRELGWYSTLLNF